MGNGLLLLCPIQEGWDLAEDSRCPAKAGAVAEREEPAAECGDPRQPVGEDDGKRGARGYDAGKKVNGRKRHLLVDVLGLILAVVVHPADIQDRDGARLVFDRVRGLLPRLKKVWADGGYAGQLVEWVKSSFRWVLEIVSRPAEACGFEVLPRRWIVERTFGWFNRYRRLSKDYEFLTDTSETMIYIAMIHLMLKRLRPCQAA
jgi:putative transposase